MLSWVGVLPRARPKVAHFAPFNARLAELLALTFDVKCAASSLPSSRASRPLSTRLYPAHIASLLSHQHSLRIAMRPLAS